MRELQIKRRFMVFVMTLMNRSVGVESTLDKILDMFTFAENDNGEVVLIEDAS